MSDHQWLMRERDSEGADAAAVPGASEGYVPPRVRVLGTLGELTLGGMDPISDGTAGAS